MSYHIAFWMTTFGWQQSCDHKKIKRAKDSSMCAEKTRKVMYMTFEKWK